METDKILEGEYYHIYNRGVEGRDTFLDGADYFRFVAGLQGFNHSGSIFNLHRYDQCELAKKISNPCQPLVEIICYALLPNHYHLILRQISKDGIPKFMHKLGTGYTNYFNKRRQRSGVLFQGNYRYKHIASDEYLLHLSRYIHLNPLSLLKEGWKFRRMEYKQKAELFLLKYKWHSLPFWLQNRPCIIKLNPAIVLEQFNSKERYKDFLADWMSDGFENIEHLIIEKQSCSESNSEHFIVED